MRYIAMMFLIAFALAACDGPYETDQSLDELQGICNNGDRDTQIGESDVDCGGLCGNLPEPANLCGQGRHCNDDRDCNNVTASLVCVNNTCQPRSTSGCPAGCPSGQVCQGNVCVTPTPSACAGGCPQGQSCVNNVCQAVPFGGTPTISMSVICWGYPQINGTTPNTTLGVSAGTLFICPAGFDGSFTAPVGTTGSCHNGHSVNAGNNWGLLTTGAHGCQR